MSAPPGIPPCSSFVITAQGNAEDYAHWRPYTVVKRYTNAFVWDPKSEKILLGLKKRGFGKGMYNGFGGKVDPGETVLEAAVRELKEEAGIDAALEPCGLLFFVGEGSEFAHHIAVFKATAYTGAVTESDEMRPEWFSFPSPTSASDLAPFPYSLMWKDDPLWVPHLLADKPFVARVDYGPVLDGVEIESGMQRWWVATVDQNEFQAKHVWEA